MWPEVRRFLSNGRDLGVLGQTIGTLTVHHHMRALDRANAGEAGGRFDGVKAWPHEINDLAALMAEKMVVTRGERLETSLTFPGFKPLHHLALFKGGQRPVDGIQRKGRQAFGQPLMQGFRRRMIASLQQFPVDLQALLRDLESCSFANRLELAE